MIERSSETVSMLQIVMIMMLAIGLNNHVIIIPLLLHASGRDAWFAGVLSVLPMSVVALLLQYVIQTTGQQHIGRWLKDRLPPLFVNILLLLSTAPLYLIAVITLRDTVHWARMSFLPTTPYLALLIPLAIICFYAAYSGITSLAITSGILLPLVVLFGFFVMTANFPHKDTSLLFPILANGWPPVLKGVLYAMSGLSEVFALVFIQHHVKTKIRFWMLLVIVLILTELIAGPVYGAISEYGAPEAANLRYPPFEEWRLVTLGYLWTNLDFFAIYQWLSGTLIRISLAIYMILEMFSVHKGKRRLWLLTTLFLAAIILSMIPFNEQLLFSYFDKVLIPGQFLWWSAAMLILTFLVFLVRKKKVAPR